MKRKIFAVLAVGAIALVSCKKEEPIAPADPGSAEVRGTLWANTDTQNDTDDLGNYMQTYETAPAGITVTAVINSADLDENPDWSYDYKDIKVTAVTDANGNYVLTGLPCYNTAIDCQIRFNDFTADQDQGSEEVETDYFGDTYWVTIFDGAVVIQDYTY